MPRSRNPYDRSGRIFDPNVHWRKWLVFVALLILGAYGCVSYVVWLALSAT